MIGNSLNLNYPIADPVKDVAKILDWYRKECLNPESKIVRLPKRDVWKSWDDNRLWCTFFFSITSPGGSSAAREYLKYIEDGSIEFELPPNKLGKLSELNRMKALWEFGTGKNYIGKRLGRFFSKPERIGSDNSLESRLFKTFDLLSNQGFMEFFEKLDDLSDDREKAKALEFLPGSKLKVSRDFLNNIGMTDTLIPLDVHVLAVMQGWGWQVPRATPSDRSTYESIEDAVRDIAFELKCTIVEIDKAIFSSRVAMGNPRQSAKVAPLLSPTPKTSSPVSDEHSSPRPGSIWAQIYRGMTYEEIKAINPFANRKWINDTAKLSEKRLAPLKDLFENNIEISKADIAKRTVNKGQYAAFRAIAHDIASWDEERQVLVKISLVN